MVFLSGVNTYLKNDFRSICIDYLAIQKRIESLVFGSLTPFLEFICKGPIFIFSCLDFLGYM